MVNKKQEEDVDTWLKNVFQDQIKLLGNFEFKGFVIDGKIQFTGFNQLIPDKEHPIEIDDDFEDDEEENIPHRTPSETKLPIGISKKLSLRTNYIG